MISANQLNKTYQKDNETIWAVKDLNLFIDSGEKVAIVGKSGSGKSTLLNLLAGLDQPTSGSLQIDSQNLKDFSSRKMASYRLKSVGVIFQSFQLIAQRTALQNIELPLILSGCRKRERIRRVNEALESVGIADRSQHRPFELSGGQQQRVAIARAIVNRPKILLADEPTGNLDSVTADQIGRLLLDLCDQLAITFVLVTHDYSLAKKMCQRIITLEDGSIQESCNVQLSQC